ncbi:MAG: NCS2 family permease [Acidobacteria bacterium]|nr:NCS2 family permease [Acidobacteriota bacterium]
MLERLFKLREHHTTARTEIVAGLVTFLTMAYVIFVNPAVLSTDFAGQPTGLSFDAAMLATCLAAFVASVLMGLCANLPIAQAPGMGENFFFVTVVMGVTAAGVADGWKTALSIVFISGVLFLLLSLLRFRKAVMDAVSPSLKNGIALGIGLFIAFIGLRNAGVILDAPPGSLVMLNKSFAQPHVAVFFGGLLVTAVLQARRVRGAILWGILFSAALGVLWGKIRFAGVFGLPSDHAFFQFDFRHVLRPDFIAFIVVFLFMDLFDTVGTLIGVGEQAGIMRDNRLPNANRALVSDAVGTVVGAASGTSTVTSYIESCVGVEAGGRTGLMAVSAGCFFLAALFFTPLVGMIGGGWMTEGGSVNPVTAPALVIVGAMMVRNVVKIDWQDATEGIPAFLVLIGIPLSYSIADGLALGCIAYPVLKLAAGRGREANGLIWVVAVHFVLRYLFIHV